MVQFDAITPVPSPEQVHRQQRRTRERQVRQQRVGDQRRSSLLDVAWTLWEQAGAQGFNMRELAHRAGYTAGALYAYFPGRETILMALQQRVVGELGDKVRAVRPRRTDRQARPRGTEVLSDASVWLARSLYLDRTLAWWTCLATDTHRLQLVLHGGHGQMTPLEPESGAASVTLARLTDAVQPCLEALLAMGLPPEVALPLHDEVLSYGFGLLVLQGPQAAGLPAAMEPRFVQSLQRWLDHASSEIPSRGLPSGVEQGDLFAG
jgi:AcrR family transcriptional regulator